MTKEEKQKVFKNFLKKYSDKYKENDLAEIETFIDYYIDKGAVFGNDRADQVLSYLGFYHKTVDPYNKFINIAEKYHEIKNSNILEIAPGLFPTLAIKIADIQKGKSGTITVFDPKIIIDKFDNINIQRKPISKNTKVENINLLIGTKTCNSIIPAMEFAAKQNIPYTLGMCTCDHSSEYELHNIKQWRDYVVAFAKETSNSDFKVITNDYYTDINKNNYKVISKVRK